MKKKKLEPCPKKKRNKSEDEAKIEDENKIYMF
jgi:hypothetical protein